MLEVWSLKLEAWYKIRILDFKDSKVWKPLNDFFTTKGSKLEARSSKPDSELDLNSFNPKTVRIFLNQTVKRKKNGALSLLKGEMGLHPDLQFSRKNVVKPRKKLSKSSQNNIKVCLFYMISYLDLDSRYLLLVTLLTLRYQRYATDAVLLTLCYRRDATEATLPILLIENERKITKINSTNMFKTIPNFIPISNCKSSDSSLYRDTNFYFVIYCFKLAKS